MHASPEVLIPMPPPKKKKKNEKGEQSAAGIHLYKQLPRTLYENCEIEQNV